jgi:hypothetical protein
MFVESIITLLIYVCLLVLCAYIVIYVLVGASSKRIGDSALSIGPNSALRMAQRAAYSITSHCRSLKFALAAA